MPSPMLPWGYTVITDPNKDNPPLNKAPEVYGPFQMPNIDSGELTQVVQGGIAAVSKAVANASRMFSTTTNAAAKQAEEPAWYNIPARISSAASGMNDAFQSTLLKVIILVSVVGVVAIFGLSYVQAKGGSLGGK